MTPEPAASSTKAATAAAASTKDVGKFVDLPGAEDGKVVTRFPPEASGYLHIGHAKAALLNEYYAKAFNGTMLMRFDDTNPSKEKEDFEHVILDDLRLLEVSYHNLSYTSDHFDKLIEYCEQLLRAGLAYVDDTDPEKMKEEREARIESKNRQNAADVNMKMWADMKNATEHGKKCAVRAKIDMQSANGCMRDPTIYRCKAENHPRTKDKHKVYPTYDFACPIVDSLENVTHALRTTEYLDRDAQYYWFIEKLNLRKPYIYSYGRLCMMNTVLSKRKLAWFVEQGLVDGWDDPRFPTVRGILRHGLTVEGLKSFIIAQGSSRNVIQMEWDKIWAFNKKVIDPIAPRYVSVVPRGHVVVEVEDAQERAKNVSLHPKNDSIGSKAVLYGPRLIIDYADAEVIRENELVTFMEWGNLLIKSIESDARGNIQLIKAKLQLDNTDFKKTTKITWLAAPPTTQPATEISKHFYDKYFTPCVLIYFDQIISKATVGKTEDFKQFVNQDTKFEICMLGEYDVRKVKRGEIIQFLRRGFFICDQPYAEVDPLTGKPHRPCIFFYVPDGRSAKSMQELMPSTGKFQESAEVGSGDAPTKSGLNATVAKTAEGATKTSDSSSVTINEILEHIKAQGDKIRKMKDDKATKEVIKAEVDQLVKLKNDYKTASGKEWTARADQLSEIPSSAEVRADNSSAPPKAAAQQPASKTSAAENDILKNIKVQGDKIRKMKEDKATKEVIKAEVDQLVELKKAYKTASGKEWTAQLNETASSAEVPANTSSALPKVIVHQQSTKTNTAELDVLKNIKTQGDTIRQLKEQKATKDVIKTEVDKLVSLKSEYKALSNKEWTVELNNTLGGNDAAPSSAPTAANNVVGYEILKSIKAQGDVIRQLKEQKAMKDAIKVEVDMLIKLKTEYEAVSGRDWTVELNNTVG